MSDVFLKTDVEIEALKTLELLDMHLKYVEGDPYQWKWIILALHSLIQNVMVLYLTRGNDFHVFRVSKSKKQREIFWEIENNNNLENINKLRLPEFGVLYDAIQSPANVNHAFNATSKHNDAMKKLNDFRNSFIHFAPTGWSLQVNQFPDLCCTLLSIVEHSISTGEIVGWFLDGEDETFVDLFTSVVERTEALKRAYAS